MSIIASYVNTTTFTVATDLTSSLMIGRRVKADCGIDSYKYGTISGSNYTSPSTTVILTATSDNLTSNLESVTYGIIGTGTNQSMPTHGHTAAEGDGGTVYGEAGTSGSSGTSGVDGTSGSSGSSGTSGEAGTSGSSGTSGADGTSGSSGSSGTSGADGTSGSSGTSGPSDHGLLTGLDDDDHSQYILVDGTKGFTSTVSGTMPTEDYHLATKEYADTLSGTGQTNTASNLGAGEGVYSTKIGADLQFKSLIGGDNITLSSDSNEITISGTTGGGGTSGTSGSSGTSGADGTSGSSGTSGADGTSGSSGSSGTSGVAGTSGSSGTSGEAGTSGSSGSSGTSGADGTSGSSGSSGTSGVGGLSNVVEDTSPSLGGNLNLNEYYIELKPSPISDDAGGGFFSTAIVDTNNVGIGAPLYMNTDGNYDEADADSVDSVDKMIVLALETGTGSKKVLHYGYMRNDGWNWTLVGSPVYISKTQGVLTQIVVSGTGEQIKRVGYATASGTIFFNPSINVGEI